MAMAYQIRAEIPPETRSFFFEGRCAYRKSEWWQGGKHAVWRQLGEYQWRRRKPVAGCHAAIRPTQRHWRLKYADDAGCERVVRAAEEIARLRPEDPEQMPFVEKQDYSTVTSFGASRPMTPMRKRVPMRSQPSIEPSIKKNLVLPVL